MRRLRQRLLIGLATTAVAGSATAAPAYYDLLDLHGAPKSPSDRSFNIFFDAGSWQGYSLPPLNDAQTGFSGPFVHSLGDGRWVGARIAALTLTDADSGRVLTLAPDEAHSHAAPGYLVRAFTAPGLSVRETLFFADSWRAVVRIELTATKAERLNLAVDGQLEAPAEASQTSTAAGVTQTFAGSHSTLTTRLIAGDAQTGQAALTADGYRLSLAGPLRLRPHRPVVAHVEQTLLYDSTRETPPPVDDAAAWTRNRARWAGYLKTAPASHLAGAPDATARRVAVKAMITLLANWRAARGDLRHDGVIPSYSNPDFNGFWAWDSWKHVAALAHFAPNLAREQMRALFDDQAADGMVPDCVYLNKADDNWRDTKPPLASWAVLEVYRATGDKAFLAEFYDKLVRYHLWWFKARDHAHDGLAEYGSTDGTRIAAAWESGMDNAVRFDQIAMLKNTDGAWSADQQSVDLNAYLYAEDLQLARIAAILGKAADSARWRSDAKALQAAVQARMFDPKRGYFFDAKLGSGDLVRVYGSEGWSPLWTGLASPGQASQVAKVMLDPGKFATVMPFPTLAADEAQFSPIKGYWRGPVWLDQAYFAVEGLRRYGYGKEADAMARRLVLNAKGLTGQAPIYENYDPLTGQGYQSPNFSWAAAHYLLLLQDKAADRR